jgi:hypothetical protein
MCLKKVSKKSSKVKKAFLILKDDFNASLLQSSILLDKKSITPLKLCRFTKSFLSRDRRVGGRRVRNWIQNISLDFPHYTKRSEEFEKSRISFKVSARFLEYKAKSTHTTMSIRFKIKVSMNELWHCGMRCFYFVLQN